MTYIFTDLINLSACQLNSERLCAAQYDTKPSLTGKL